MDDEKDAAGGPVQVKPMGAAQICAFCLPVLARERIDSARTRCPRWLRPMDPGEFDGIVDDLWLSPSHRTRVPLGTHLGGFKKDAVRPYSEVDPIARADRIYDDRHYLCLLNVWPLFHGRYEGANLRTWRYSLPVLVLACAAMFALRPAALSPRVSATIIGLCVALALISRAMLPCSHLWDRVPRFMAGPRARFNGSAVAARLAVTTAFLPLMLGAMWTFGAAGTEVLPSDSLLTRMLGALTWGLVDGVGGARDELTRVLWWSLLGTAGLTAFAGLHIGVWNFRADEIEIYRFDTSIQRPRHSLKRALLAWVPEVVASLLAPGAISWAVGFLSGRVPALAHALAPVAADPGLLTAASAAGIFLAVTSFPHILACLFQSAPVGNVQLAVTWHLAVRLVGAVLAASCAAPFAPAWPQVAAVFAAVYLAAVGVPGLTAYLLTVYAKQGMCDGMSHAVHRDGLRRRARERRRKKEEEKKAAEREAQSA